MDSVCEVCIASTTIGGEVVPLTVRKHPGLFRGNPFRLFSFERCNQGSSRWEVFLSLLLLVIQRAEGQRHDFCFDKENPPDCTHKAGRDYEGLSEEFETEIYETCVHIETYYFEDQDPFD